MNVTLNKLYHETICDRLITFYLVSINSLAKSVYLNISTLHLFTVITFYLVSINSLAKSVYLNISTLHLFTV